jgi:ribosome-associated protein
VSADPGSDNYIVIDETLRIPKSELQYRATRSGGPGGQHVNTSSTRVELTWNPGASSSLTDAQRALLLQRLARRLDASGDLHMTSSRTRSQARNRDDVTERFARLIANALREEKPRRRTRPPRAAAEARLEEKRRRAERKARRVPPTEHD